MQMLIDDFLKTFMAWSVQHIKAEGLSARPI